MNFLESMLSFIFPPTCGICGKENKNYICSSCIEKLKEEKIYMPYIENYTKMSHCYIFKYDGTIRKKILQYKFKDSAYLYKMFSEFFVKNEKVCRFLKNYDIIIPVPMTKKKIAKRGYNQCELIAKEIAVNTKNLEYLKNILVKQKETNTQSTLNKKERLNNVKNAYKIQNMQKIKEKNIILFDDIYTTGATCIECAKTIINAGAKSVGLLTIAKDFQKIK